MCQQWLSVAGHFLELIGFLIIAFELAKLFNRERKQGNLQGNFQGNVQGNLYVYSFGVFLMAVGMLGQTAGGWVGRLPIDGIWTCF